MPTKEPLERAIDKSNRDVLRLETELALRTEDLSKAEIAGLDFDTVEAAAVAVRKATFALTNERRRNSNLKQQHREQRSEAARAAVAEGAEKAIAAGLKRAALHRELAALTYEYLAGISQMQEQGGAAAATQFPMMPVLIIPMAGAASSSFGAKPAVDTALESFEFGLRELQRKGVKI